MREFTEKGHTELRILPVVVQRHEPVVFENMQAKLDCTCLPGFYIVVVLKIEILLMNGHRIQKSTKIFDLTLKSLQGAF